MHGQWLTVVARVSLKVGLWRCTVLIPSTLARTCVRENVTFVTPVRVIRQVTEKSVWVIVLLKYEGNSDRGRVKHLCSSIYWNAVVPDEGCWPGALHRVVVDSHEFVRFRWS